MRKKEEESVTDYLKRVVEVLIGGVEKFDGAHTFSTCNHSNWCHIQYTYRNEIVEEIKKRGYIVWCEINHGVMDYRIRKQVNLG